jgi:dynactin complex subunit
VLTHENEQLKADVQKASSEEKAQAKELNKLNLQNQKQQSALDSAAKALEEAKRDLTETRKELKQSQAEAAKLEGMLKAYNKKPSAK